MAPASSVVSARAMALGSITQHRNRTKVADFCSAPVAGFYAAIDTEVRKIIGPWDSDPQNLDDRRVSGSHARLSLSARFCFRNLPADTCP